MDTIQIDYRSLPYKDLKAIRDQVDAVMAEQLEETKRKLRGQFLTVADEHGLSFKDITHPDDVEIGEATRKKMLAGVINHSDVEKRYIRKDGSTLWVDIAASALSPVETRSTA